MSGNQHIPFSALPLDPNGPPDNAWGRFGDDDELGMLNLLTPDVVSSAAKEIRTGVRVSLDWPLTKPAHPSFGRVGLRHEIRNRGGGAGLRVVNDDFLSFNTQSSSQWDGFRHYGYLKEKRYYNGRTHDQVVNSSVIGVNVWAENGGIVGRGVLLDYCSWAKRNHVTLKHFESQRVPLAHIKSVVEEQGISFNVGDILCIRFGFTAAFDALQVAEQRALPQRPSPEFLGLEGSEEVAEWLWENQFAAVLGDAPAFETSPVHVMEETSGLNLHQRLLGGWGMPIGELFDLEKLAELCQQQNRHSFFFSSVPLKVPGLVASPPNAIAIF